MRYRTLMGLSAPLLAGILAAGCETPLIDIKWAANPTVVAMFGTGASIGQATGTSGWSDTMFYSAAEPAKTSPLPAYYPHIKIEFDQPVDGATVANQANRASYCTQLGATDPNIPVAAAIQFIDVDDGGASIPSSVCYDSGSYLGGHPGVTIIPGASATNSFTCQAFSPAGGLLEAHNYKIKFDTTKIKNNAGGTLKLPTGAGWSADGYQFKTDDFGILAVGYVDPNNLAVVALDKPGSGWLKDLVPNPAFTMLADGSPLAIVLSGPVETDNHGNALGVTITRGTGEDFGGVAIGDSNDSSFTGDDTVITVYPEVYWEPGATYKITTTAATKNVNTGTSLPAAQQKSWTFKAAAGTQNVVTVAPVNNQTGVAVSTSITLTFTDPVDPTLATVDNIQLLKGGTVVATGAPVELAAQAWRITPTAPLDPSTTYTVSVKNLKVAPAPAANAGKPFPAFTSTFTTANFRANLFSLKGSSTSIDRSVSVSPLALFSGLRVRFNRPVDATTVSADSIVLYEVNATTGAKTKVPATVTPTSGATDSFDIAVTDGSYPAKFGQKYTIVLSTSIKSSAGLALKAEVCGADCSDQGGFTTAPFVPTVTATAATGVFKVAFNYAVDAVTTDAAAKFKLVKVVVNADGTQTVTDTAVTCTTFAADTALRTVTCTPNSPLDTNSTYVASVQVQQSAPAKVAATLSTHPTDASGTFAGGRTARFVTPCPSPP